MPNDPLTAAFLCLAFTVVVGLPLAWLDLKKGSRHD